MNRNKIKRLFLSSWRGHIILCAAALASTIPFLFNVEGSEAYDTLCSYCGYALYVAFHLSLLVMVVRCVYLTLHLRNLRAFWHVCAWLILWACTAGLYAVFAIVADVPPPITKEATKPIQESDTLYQPDEHLLGPDSLVILISSDDVKTDALSAAPNLSKLAVKHEEYLVDFLSKYTSRWAAADSSDTFYTRHGHVVLQLPGEDGEAPRLVHAAFRTLVGGDALPEGYTVLRPGDDFPTTGQSKGSTPSDIALDLGKQHYLLLACRGIAPGEPTRRALNAAISTIDEQFSTLAQNPTPESAAKFVEGKRNIAGQTPSLRVCEPLAQFGVYQAEIYANPGEPGTLVLFIKDLKSGSTLRLFNCTARYSNNPNELFRHDIPSSSPSWMQSASTSKVASLFPRTCPIFAITEGTAHHYFGVAFEVEFIPANGAEPNLLLRRCYKVQPYEAVPPTPPKDLTIPDLQDPEEGSEEPAPLPDSTPEPKILIKPKHTPEHHPTEEPTEPKEAPAPKEEPAPTPKVLPKPDPKGSATLEPTVEPEPATTEEPTSAPTDAPAPAPAEEPAPAPEEEPSPAPEEEPTPAPAEEPSPAPAEEPSPAPAEEPAPAPVEEPAPSPQDGQ